MAEPRLCPQCSAELPTETLEGLCPKCLLTAGLDNSASDQVPAADDATIAPSQSDSSSSPPGTKVHYFGDYELLDEIARGGMGVVHKARQVKLNRTVALKMILAGQLASEEDVKRFHTEAEAAANLQHANIVSIHEVGEHEGQHYFSMDYVDGPSLAEIVRQHPLGAKKAAQYVKTIAEAIHYAHGEGILHRDLKPSNILIDRSDQPRITDFGLAKRIESDSKLTASGAVLGTPSYMPPEQAAAKRGLIGPPSDVYSLGAVLYELLAGRPPFQAATPLDTLRQAMEKEPASLRLLNPDVPADLETICSKCLEKRPEQRYLTAQELADDLGRFLNHEPIHARPAGSVRKLWSWSKRRPWLFARVASICLLALLAVVYWQWVVIDFQRHAMTHPDYVKQPGARTDLMEALTTWDGGLLFVLLIATLGLSAQFRRRKLVGTRILPQSLAAYSAVGMLGLGSGIYTLMKGIEAFVWEEDSILITLLFICFVLYMGLELVWRVIREIEWSTFGANADAEVTISADLSEEQIDRIDELLLANKKLEAVFYYIDATRAPTKDPSKAIDQYEIELFRKHPEKAPPYPETVILKGCFAPLFVITGPLFFLAFIVGIMTGDPFCLAGLIGFSTSAGATVLYRENNKQFTQGQCVFVALFFAGIAFMAFFFRYPLFSIGIGSLIGVAAGVLYVCFIPLLRSLRLLCLHGSKGSMIEPPPTSVNWKHRLRKAMVISSIAGAVLGLVPGIVMLAFGKIESHETTEFFLGCFVAFPAVTALVLAVAAAAGISILRYLNWISGDK